MTWQVHVYGKATSDLMGWCTRHNLPAHVIDWRSEHEAAGLARDAPYLLRPDTYLALADAAPDTLEHYFAEPRIGIPRGPRVVA